MRFKKIVISFVVLWAIALPAAAAAHVVVTPGAVAPGSFNTFTMSVPNEKDNPTVKVQLAIPKGLVVYSVEAVPGWSWVITRVAGRITKLTVTGSLPPGYFQRFAFVAAAPKKPAVMKWKALQTYEDGSVVRWTGEPGAEEVSTTVVGKKAAAMHDDHGNG